MRHSTLASALLAGLAALAAGFALPASAETAYNIRDYRDEQRFDDRAREMAREPDRERDLKRWNEHNYNHRFEQQNQWRTEIDRRQERLAYRIAQGERRGELDRGEARRLWHEQRFIRDQERRYLSDGILSWEERRKLNEDLNVATRHIEQERHDRNRGW